MKYGKIIAMLLLVALLAVLCACGEEEAFSYRKTDLSKYIELGEYKGIELTYEVAKVTEEDVEWELRDFCEQLATFVEYEQTEGQVTVAYDYLQIDFVGYMDGEMVADATAEGQYILLCDDSGYIDWFEDDLYGVTVGTTVVSTGNFPEDYYEDLAGKEITFHITVTAIMGHYDIPELTDELIAEHTDHETVEAARSYLFDAIANSRRAALEEQVYADLWAALMERCTVIQYPEQPVEDYYQMYYSYVQEYATYAGYEDVFEFMEKELDLTEEDMREDARASVCEELIVFSIIKAENLTVTDEEYAEAVAGYAEYDGVSFAELEESYGREYLEECVLYDKALEFVYNSANILYIEK